MYTPFYLSPNGPFVDFNVWLLQIFANAFPVHYSPPTGFHFEVFDDIVPVQVPFYFQVWFAVKYFHCCKKGNYQKYFHLFGLKFLLIYTFMNKSRHQIFHSCEKWNDEKCFSPFSELNEFVQDNPLIFDYNVQERVNDFINAAITQVNSNFFISKSTKLNCIHFMSLTA